MSVKLRRVRVAKNLRKQKLDPNVLNHMAKDLRGSSCVVKLGILIARCLVVVYAPTDVLARGVCPVHLRMKSAKHAELFNMLWDCECCQKHENIFAFAACSGGLFAG